VPDFPTASDLFRVARDKIVSKNGNIRPESVDKDGTDTNILVAAMAAVGDEVIRQLTVLEAGVFKDSATGDALVRLLFDRYGLRKKSAAPAFVTVNFTTTAPAASSFAIPSGTLLQSQAGSQFVTVEDATFPVGAIGPILVVARSILAGANQQVGANAIKAIVSQVSGSPADLAVNNPKASFGADDEEDEDTFRQQAVDFFTSARRGTLTAIQNAALAVPGVRRAAAFEVLDSLGRPGKEVELVVADAFVDQLANLSSVPPSYQVQSQAFSTQVFAALDDARAVGIFVDVVVASVVMLGVQLALAFTAGTDPHTAALQARALVVGYVNGLSPGQPFVPQDLITSLKSVSGLIVSSTTIVSPAGSIVPGVLQVLRTTLALVSALSLQTDRPLATGLNPDAFR
jgi:hypothetical protein